MSFKIPVLAASLLGVATLAGPVAAQVVAADVVAGDNFPRMQVSFPNEVTAMPDLVYSTIPGFQPLKLDLYAPARRSASRGLPLVIYVHGGAWMGGHSRAAGAFADFPGVLASLSARGYVVASLNYRLSGEARFPAALHDVRAALRYLRANAARFGIDPRRVFLWGASAGGQLASLAATTCGMTTLDPSWGPGQAAPPAGSECVQGAVIWYGAFDLSALEAASAAGSGNSPTAAYLGCDPGRCPETAALASPVTQVDRSDPPMLLIHGLDDRVVPAEQTNRMAALLREAGVRVEMLLIPDVGHSWIGRSPAETRRASLLALRRTFAFIDTLSRHTPWRRR